MRTFSKAKIQSNVKSSPAAEEKTEGLSYDQTELEAISDKFSPEFASVLQAMAPVLGNKIVLASR